MKKKLCLILLSVAALLFLLPVGYTLMKSFRYEDSGLTLRQYLELLTTNYTVLRFFWNSMLYAMVITVVCIAVSFPIGFLFAKIRFRGSEVLFFIYIVVMLLPFQATLLPNYLGLQALGLLDKWPALVLPMMFSPLAVFMFRQTMRGIPVEQVEYTMLETNSVIRMLFHVVLPQMKGAIIALTILIFCESWNMVEQVMIFADRNEAIWPLSVMLTRLPEDVTYAGAVVYLYPVLVLFLCFRNTFREAMEKFKW